MSVILTAASNFKAKLSLQNGENINNYSKRIDFSGETFVMKYEGKSNIAVVTSTVPTFSKTKCKTVKLTGTYSR